MALRLTPTLVRSWADEIGITNQLLAELDLRLVQLLEAGAQDSVLVDKLYLKGGTALNKLYLKELSRLSNDLDFNHIGVKEDVLRERKDVVEHVMQVIRLQNGSYSANIIKQRYEQTTIRVTYPPLAGGPPQRIKIEISHVERFPVVPAVRRELRLPAQREVTLTTYRPEELLATKIRALYDRLKGRDVYDLWAASKALPLDATAVRKLCLYYFYRARKILDWRGFFRRLNRAVTEGAIDDDVTGFTRPDAEFQLGEGARTVREWLRFLGDLDEADREFLLLARLLLGKGDIPKRLRARVESIEYPLGHLFGPRFDITREAQGLTVDQMRPYAKETGQS